jgi:hypothetical protein
VEQRKEDPWLRRHRGRLRADSVVSEQGSALAYVVTEWVRLGSRTTYAAPKSGVLRGLVSRVDVIQDLRTEV